MFVGKVVHVVADAFGNRTCSLSASQVEVQRRDDIADEHRIEATTIPRIHGDREGATIHRGIGLHERFGNMRAHNVVRGQPHPASVGVAHAGDFVFSEVETQSPLLSRILRQVQRATCKFCEPEATHPGLPSAIGREMLVEVGSAVFDDQRLSEWLAGSGGSPRVHEVHQRLHVADRVVPRETDRGRIVREMRDTHLAQRAPPPSSRGAVHRVDEPQSRCPPTPNGSRH